MNQGAATDRILEHRLRLAICVLLTRHERLSFARLKQLTEETDGNLGANLRRLEEAGFLEASKEFVDRKPVTWYAITASGEKTLRAHLDGLSRLIAQVPKNVPKNVPRRPTPRRG